MPLRRLFITLYKKAMNIIIIGATSGIGKALFENYVTKGNIVAIIGRRTNLLEQLKQDIPLIQ